MKFSLLCQVVLLSTLLQIGCVSNQTKPYDFDSQASGATKTISFGAAKKFIIPGKTTDEDVIKLFGSPDNMIRRNNREIWIYDRFKVETSSQSESAYGTIILFGGSSKSSSSSTTVRNLTIIIDFNENGVVEDIQMRQGGY